jgi:hypothetical protein
MLLSSVRVLEKKFQGGFFFKPLSLYPIYSLSNLQSTMFHMEISFGWNEQDVLSMPIHIFKKRAKQLVDYNKTK